jgi:hypothetical protein
MWQCYDFEAMGKERPLLVATAGIIDALHCHSDRRGKSYSMLSTLPPIVSEKQLITHVNAYNNTEKQDKDWRVHFDICFKLIGKHYVSDNYLHWPLMQIPWWEMGHSKLMDIHKQLFSQRL